MDYCNSKYLSRAHKKPLYNGLAQLSRASLIAKSSDPLINLAPGFPSPEKFLFTEIKITLEGGSTLTIGQKELAVGLQYAPSEGIHSLLALMRDFTIKLHNPPTAHTEADDEHSFDLIITNGATEAFQKCFDVLLDTDDAVVVESPCFSSAINSLPIRCKGIMSIETDHLGMIPDKLRQALEQRKEKNMKPPKVLYVVPCGGNPRASTMSLERKQQVYQICQEYDLLIIEDDPYYFVNFKPLVASFLSLDVDGRVLRCDSFAKVLMPGLRLGVLSGPKRIVQSVRCLMTYMTTCNGPLAQTMLYKTLSQLGLDGFLEHAKRLADFYKSRRDFMAHCVEKYLTGLAEWTVPESGLFFWLKLKNVADAEKLIMEKALPAEVILVPGIYFMRDKSVPCPFVRACYSFASCEEMEEGIKRFACVLKDK